MIYDAFVCCKLRTQLESVCLSVWIDDTYLRPCSMSVVRPSVYVYCNSKLHDSQLEDAFLKCNCHVVCGRQSSVVYRNCIPFYRMSLNGRCVCAHCAQMCTSPNVIVFIAQWTYRRYSHSIQYGKWAWASTKSRREREGHRRAYTNKLYFLYKIRAK